MEKIAVALNIVQAVLWFAFMVYVIKEGGKK